MPKLKYSFDDYIRNPSGKGSAVTAAIDKNKYNTDLLGLESRNGKSQYTIYRQSKGMGKVSYIIHFKIPSSTKGFFHDVVVSFEPNPKDSTKDTTIKNFFAKFFCNDDNFVYTYAYAFKTHGLLIQELERLLPFRSLNQKANMRNPDNAMGYNKNIVFAYLIMERSNLFSKDILNRNSKNAGINIVRNTIDSYDKKQHERNKIKEDQKKTERKEKEQQQREKVIKSKNLLGNTQSILPKITKTVSNSKTVKKISGIKKSKRR